jgi:hypothetical protein
VREQAKLLRLDADAAIDALPGLLANVPSADLSNAARNIEKVGTTLPLDEQERTDLARVLAIFEAAAKEKPQTTRRTAATQKAG